jgi:DNA polymerase III subunit beta
MHFTISKSDINAMITSIYAATEKTGIYSYLWVEVKDDTLRLIASDGEFELMSSAKVLPNTKDAPTVEGIALLPAAKFKSLISAAPNGVNVEIKHKEKQAYLLSYVGLRSRYTLQALDSEFPLFPSAPANSDPTKCFRFSVDAKTFSRTLDNVSGAMANQDVRYYLNGMCWSAKGNVLSCTSTDGHRLMQDKIAITPQHEDASFNVIIARKTILELPKLFKGMDKELRVILTHNHMFVSFGDRYIKTLLIDGNFPDTSRVIPKHLETQVTIKRLEFLSTLKRAAILANEKTKGMRLTFNNNTVKFEASNTEQDTSHEEMEITQIESTSATTGSVEIGVNAGYLIDAFSTYQEDEILFTYTDGANSMLLRSLTNPDSINVVMPMRV